MATLKDKAITFGLTLTLGLALTTDHLLDTWFITPLARRLHPRHMTHLRLVRGLDSSVATASTKRVEASQPSTLLLRDRQESVLGMGTDRHSGTSLSRTLERLGMPQVQTGIPQGTDIRST